MALSPRHRPVVLLALAGLACGGGSDPALNALPDPVAANAPPVIERMSFTPTNPIAGDTLRVLAESSDPDGDPIAYAYVWTVDGKTAESGTSALELTNAQKGQRISVRVIASDGKLESPSAERQVEVADRPASVTGLEVSPGFDVIAGEWITVSPRTVDPDGDVPELVHRWTVNGQEIESETEARFNTKGLRRGDEVAVTVSVAVSDISQTGSSLTSLPIQIRNAPPRVTSRPSPPRADGFHYQVEAIDPDGDTPLEFSLKNPPRGMTIGALTGEIRWKPSQGQAGSHPIEVHVNDPHGGRVLHAFELQVGNSPPPASGSTP